MKNPKAKGSAGERGALTAVLKAFNWARHFLDKRNSQAAVYGGSSNPDIQFYQLDRFHCEVKNTKTFRFNPARLQVLKDCGWNKIPILIWRVHGEADEFWIAFRVSDLWTVVSEFWAANEVREKEESKQ